MNIKGLNKAVVLMALFNASKQQGLGTLQKEGVANMDIDRAKYIIAGCGEYLEWDYLHGRVMKIDITEDEVDTRLYNRDNGEGAAERAIDTILVLK